MSQTLDRSQLEDIYRQCGYQVERRCRSILRNEDAARDAAQEVFIRLMTRGHEFRGEAGWMTWLYRVATNICLNKLRNADTRRRLLDQHGEVLEPGDPHPRAADVARRRQLILKIMDGFDDTTVEIALYHFVDELNQSEIGALVGMSRVSVNKRLQKFKARAAEMVREMEAA